MPVDCLPTKLEFFIGGFMGRSLKLAFEDGELTYESFEHGYAPELPRAVYPTEEAWRAFWRAVADQGVWEWEGEYKSEYLVCDGEHWSLELAYGGRSVSSGGDNAYPGEVKQGVSLELNRLSDALTQLTGGLEFGYVDPRELEDEEPAAPLTVFSFGYWGWGNHTPRLVEALNASEARAGFEPPLFVDSRFRREVRAVGFRGDAFERVVGKERYRWVKRLGNKNILPDSPPGICIADPTAVGELLDWAIEAGSRNQRIVYYCACEYPEGCHRYVISEMLTEEARKRELPLTVVEWPGGAPAINELVVPLESFKAVLRGRKSVHLSPDLTPLHALPWYSVINLVADGSGRSVPFLTGPARFADGAGWYLPVLDLGDEGQDPAVLLADAPDWRAELKYDALASTSTLGQEASL